MSEAIVDKDRAIRRRIWAGARRVTLFPVRAEETWRFATEGTWWDAWIECGPAGYRNFLADIVDIRPRAANERWFCLIGAVERAAGHEADPDSFFAIGEGVTHTFIADGMLVVFANDLASMYGNNRGRITLWAERAASRSPPKPRRKRGLLARLGAALAWVRARLRALAPGARAAGSAP